MYVCIFATLRTATVFSFWLGRDGNYVVLNAFAFATSNIRVCFIISCGEIVCCLSSSAHWTYFALPSSEHSTGHSTVLESIAVKCTCRQPHPQRHRSLRHSSSRWPHQLSIDSSRSVCSIFLFLLLPTQFALQNTNANPLYFPISPICYTKTYSKQMTNSPLFSYLLLNQIYLYFAIHIIDDILFPQNW